MDFKGYPSPRKALAEATNFSAHGGYRKSELERFTHWEYRITVREYGTVLKIPRLRKELLYRLLPFRGSQWSYMRRDHVDHVLDHVDHHPAVVRFFRRSKVPDDCFVQTILMNSSHKDEVTNMNGSVHCFVRGLPADAYDRGLAATAIRYRIIPGSSTLV